MLGILSGDKYSKFERNDSYNFSAALLKLNSSREA